MTADPFTGELADNNAPLTPPNLNNFGSHGLDISHVSSALDVLSSPSNTHHQLTHDTMSSCMDTGLEAQLIAPLLEGTSVNGHFNLCAPPMTNRTHNVTAAADQQNQQLNRDVGSPPFNETERLENDEQTRQGNYLDNFSNGRSSDSSLNNTSILAHLQTQSPHSPHNQNSTLNTGAITQTHNSNRNHPYQRTENTSDSPHTNTAGAARNPVEMTLNEYNRSGETSADEMLRRTPLKIRSSETLTAIPPNLPPTTASSTPSTYMLNSIHDPETYRMALKQEPEAGY